MKILLVDDDLLVQRSLAKGLRTRGHEVVACSSGESALEACNDSFDVAFVDILLSCDMGGVNLARTLGEIYPDLRIVGMTGGLTDDEIFSRTVFKPLTADILLAALGDA